ncbi:glycosyltransferase family 2 protein [Chryseobacterium luquanense]|uniref:Glycosyltransferase n=1 Tax=Chryseobacterium luquanense TaxID=2983766 RepID=A0ABT3Y080_9FLAO|nr:glycosyltransferase [Chryseobacterium luquanense]MCX8531514.1 glycosyltransferase [Chryseobacterium luquanense]
MKLSIVIPVYNSSRYLDDCLNSLLAQNMNAAEYELICVNDGSTDDSLKILNEYSNLHTNIKVISQENKGHSAARNTGLRAATGKYVWFVDSDDFIEENSISTIINCMDEQEIDFLTIGLCNVSNESHFIPTNKQNSIVFEKQPHNISCSGNRIFLREILSENNISWSTDVHSLDDVLFLFYVQLHSKKSFYTPSVNYFYRESPNSISRTKSSESTIKHINGLRNLINYYHGELAIQKEKKGNDSVIKNIDARVNLAVKSMLLDAIFVYDFKERKMLLEDLKSKNQYPYKLIRYDLKPKISVKRTIMDWSMLLFPIEFYYQVYGLILRKFVKLK